MRCSSRWIKRTRRHCLHVVVIRVNVDCELQKVKKVSSLWYEDGLAIAIVGIRVESGQKSVPHRSESVICRSEDEGKKQYGKLWKLGIRERSNDINDGAREKEGWVSCMWGEIIRFQVGVSLGPSRTFCAYFENGTRPAFGRVCGDLRGLAETGKVVRV